MICFFRKLLGAVLILGMSGCATVGDYTLFAGTTGSNRFSPEDVDQAIAIAKQNGDTVGQKCYEAIRNSLERPEPDVVGPVSAYAAARVTVRLSKTWNDNEVHVACSPLITDAAGFLARFRAILLR